jgi:hypothetical protein
MENNRLGHFSYFSDHVNIVFDFLLLLVALEWAEILTWGPILLLLGTMAILGEIYVIFLYISSGNDFLVSSDKVSIIAVLVLSILTIIDGGIITTFEIHQRLRGVFLMVLGIQLLTVIGLGVYFYKFKDLKPIYIKINLVKKWKTPVLDYRIVSQPYKNNVDLEASSVPIKLKRKSIKDLSISFQTVRQKNVLNFTSPDQFKIAKNLKCYGCGQESCRGVYHVPLPCHHNMYCVNCAAFLLEKVNYCLICNKKICSLYRVLPNPISNELQILSTIEYQ